MRQLTELEGVCLGIVSRLASCTAYGVRSELLASPSSSWRASAGSIYPLLTRLEGEGLVSAHEDKNDGRGRRLLRPSAKGKKWLRKWIIAGADKEHVSQISDPVRSRMFFLGTLAKREQKQYLDDVIVLMESFVEEARENLNSDAVAENLYTTLGSLGALKLNETRLEWLKQVREKLFSPNQSRSASSLKQSRSVSS